MEDLYLDLTKLKDIKSFFYIPFSGRLIDELWQHKAIDTNHDVDVMIENMFDIYDTVVVPYSANEALDFIKIG